MTTKYRQQFSGNATDAALIKQADIEIFSTENKNGKLVKFDVHVKEYPGTLDKLDEAFIQIVSDQNEIIVPLGEISGSSRANDIDVSNFERPKARVFVRNKVAAKILAKTKWFSLRKAASSEGSAHGILPIDFSDLGEELWRLKFEQDDGPVVFVNSSEELGVKELVSQDTKVLAFIFPEILRQILHKLHYSQDSEEDWIEAWKNWLQSQAAELPDEDADEDEVEDWANQVVAAFANRQKFLTKLINELEQ